MTQRSILSTLLLSIALLCSVSCGKKATDGKVKKADSEKNKQSKHKPVVFLLHGLGGSPKDFAGIKKVFKGKGIKIVTPAEKDTFGNSGEQQAENLYKKLQKRIEKAEKVAFVCISQGGPRLLAMLRKYGKELDPEGDKIKGVVFIGSPLEGTPMATDEALKKVNAMIQILKVSEGRLTPLLAPLEVLTQGGAGVTDMAPDSDCTKENVNYLKDSKIPMLFIAGKKGTMLKKALNTLGITTSLYIPYSGTIDIEDTIDTWNGSTPNHDVVVPESSALATSLGDLPNLTRHTVQNTLHGAVSNIDNSSVFEHPETHTKMVAFLAQQLELPIPAQ